MQQRGFSLRDQLFNAEKVGYLAGLFEAVDKDFDTAGFQMRVMQRLPDLELKERIVWIAEVLEGALPDDFHAATEVILSALPPPLDPDLSDDDFGDFIFAPLGEFVARNGLEKRDLGRSMAVFKELTKRFSVELCIRPFLIHHPVETLAHMAAWAGDENYHVRRLASEGSRPTLPWGVNTGLKVDAGLMLLERLYTDTTRYVTRSVANHLNDVAKQDPELVVDILARWARQGGQTPEEMGWMQRHALRTLVKRGHKGALGLLGFRSDPDITVSAPQVLPQCTAVRIGAVLEFSFEIAARKDENLMVDYVVDFIKADGSHKPKVFKLKQIALEAGARKTLTKRHRFLGNATTFRLNPGRHKLSIQVNGSIMTGFEFELVSS